MKGRPPIPSYLKVLHGNPGKRPLNKNEPMPDISETIPDPPVRLSHFAKKEWKNISGRLHRLGLLTEIDDRALVAYCESFAAWRKARRCVERDGMVTITKNGMAVLNPMMKIEKQYFDQMMKLMSEFGMTPSSRSKIAVTDKNKQKDNPDEIPLEDFKKRRSRLN